MSINLSVKKKCPECNDFFYNESDMGHIRMFGHCTLCWREIPIDQRKKIIRGELFKKSK